MELASFAALVPANRATADTPDLAAVGAEVDAPFVAPAELSVAELSGAELSGAEPAIHEPAAFEAVLAELDVAALGAPAPAGRAALGTALDLSAVLGAAPGLDAASDRASAPADGLAFLDLEGPLRVWELGEAEVPAGAACAVAVPARTPLAPPLPAALRTDAAAGVRNAAVDAVVALSAAPREPGRLRTLLRRISGR